MKNVHSKKPPHRDLLTTNVDLALYPTNPTQKGKSLLNFFKVLNHPTDPKSNGKFLNTILLSFLMVAYFTPEPTPFQMFIVLLIAINRFMELTNNRNNY